MWLSKMKPRAADYGTKSCPCRWIRRSLGSDHKVPFIRFGPVFCQDDVQIESAKDDVQIESAKDDFWQHVVKSTKDSKAATTEVYICSIRKVEEEAKDCYGLDLNLSGERFRWMMIRDGCFFLQLSFSLLGGHKDQSGLKHNSTIFLNRHKWVASMFHVGNQIPLVVLRQLLEQKYFQNVIRDRKWKRPSSDLAEMTLFQVLISPALERRRRIRIPPNICLPRLNLIWMQQLQNHSCDVFHALHLLLLGPETEFHREDEDEEEEDEYNTEEEEKGDKRDLEAGGSDHDGDDDDNKGVRPRSAAMKCATKLKQSGIHFRVKETKGIRGIRFKSNLFYPRLYLPPLFVGSHTRLLLKNLQQYESQRFNSRRHEVSSYLQFMSNLIRTSEDVKLLTSGGIIIGNRKYAEKLPKILRDLASDDDQIDHTSLGLVKIQINNYYRPTWVTEFGPYLWVVFILTFVQTFYAMLAYHKPLKDK